VASEDNPADLPTKCHGGKLFLKLIELVQDRAQAIAKLGGT